ncbi:NAD(P)-dependent alcohol dehydrogenase [Kutzneria kofuensis]|uniref:Aryl-alcohol dehydrogenase n=1 Tax=Kutzneria kofuensis TaxID=103725 RepID=A0A7W9KNA9_9PSEU|nr:NAD(P)-dependent alcohol dehydrogenase [Kutzneria kofuensis]MBB5895458.1 aryl-alcohol dehydrogenase [Kutzneria kofuensis]
MTTTRAAVLRSFDQGFSLEEITLADLRPDEVLVEIAGVGMCHTDLILRDPAMAAALAPVVLGHEGSGIVTAVGAAVSGVRTGDHVVLSFASCGTCRECLLGAPAYCEEFTVRNVSGGYPDGSTGATDSAGGPVRNRWFGQSSFARHAVASERDVVVVDPELPLELLGPLGCGMQTGAGAVLNEMRLAPGQSIAVFGAGAVGLAAVMAAKLAGARDIVVVDLLESRLDVAKELGATRIVRGGDGDITAEVAGMDFSFETTAVEKVIGDAIAVLGRRGKAVLAGVGPGLLTVPPSKLAGRTVTYVLEGSAVPKVFIPRLIGFWRDGRFPFDRLIRTYPLAGIDAAEADSLSGATIKPVLLP